MRPIHYTLSVLSCLVVVQFAYGEPTQSPLTATGADAIVLEAVARKANAEANHIANSVAFTVLERREVELDGRKLISNRVADPKLPKSVKVKAASASLNVGLPPEFLNQTERELHTLMISATIYKGEPTVTHLRWQTQDGLKLEAWSNIDWNFMRGMMTVSSDTNEFLVLQGVGLPPDGDVVPDLPPFTAGRAEYFVFADSISDLDEIACEGMDLLHSYYEANELVLKTAHQRREAITAAQIRYDTANPKKPKNAVLHFWKSEASE
jgi:hypothetical protein